MAGLRRSRIPRSTKALEPNLSPVNKLVAGAAAKRHVGAVALRAFQVYGVFHLSHLARTIDNDLVELPEHLLLLAAEEPHVRGKKQSSIVGSPIDGLSNIAYRLDLD